MELQFGFLGTLLGLGSPSLETKGPKLYLETPSSRSQVQELYGS